MSEVIIFCLTFLFVLIIYEIFIVSKTKRMKIKDSNFSKHPMEINYLINIYKLDIKKVNYNQLLQIITIVSSFDIAFVVSLINITDNFILEVLIGFVGTLGIIFFSYYLVYLFYKKKGMIKND